MPRCIGQYLTYFITINTNTDLTLVGLVIRLSLNRPFHWTVIAYWRQALRPPQLSLGC